MTFYDIASREVLTYADYRQLLETKALGLLEPGDETYADYFRLNLQRMRRIEMTYSVSPVLERTLESLQAQTWIVLTEPWCGDSAQNIPYLVKMAERAPSVSIQFLLRDKNWDVMDEYLTSGKRSIPKLVAFDNTGMELFQWGPRPAEAQEMFDRRKRAGIPLDQVKQELHLWYGRNRGRALETEFCRLLHRMNVSCEMA